jgi:hypothetical protein
MKRIPSLALLTFMLIASISCSLFDSGFTQHDPEDYKNIAWIALTGDSYTFYSRTGSATEQSLAISFFGFSGKESVWEIVVTQEVDLRLSIITNELSGGLLKICLVTGPNGEVITLLENSGALDDTLHLVPGVYVVKLVGYKARGNVSIDLPDQLPEGVSITKR